jgi:[ribosomal protein S5]-alanine N-acetyltransferase
METRWSAQNLDSIFRFVKSMESDPANYLFAIRLRTSSRHIGNLKIGPINFNHSYADLSYFIGDRDFWGKGIATEAIQGAIEFAFENLSLRRLNAGVYSSNIGSVKALQKCGFVTEGVAVDKFRIDDHFEDHIMLGLYR